MGGTTVSKPAAQAYGGDIQAAVVEVDDDEADDEADEEDEDDFVEDYERGMSPAPVDLRTMPLDERRLPIVNEEDQLRALVRPPCKYLITS